MFETFCIVLGDLVIRAWFACCGFGRRGLPVLLGSGTKWYPWAPRSEDVRFEDFAAVGWINRWGGHAGLCTNAEHAVRVADILEKGGHSAWMQLQGLVHDLAEVYPPGDVLRPVLSGPAFFTWQFRYMKKLAERALRRRLGMPLRLPAAVKVADGIALQLERQWRLPADGEMRTPLPSSRHERWEPEYALWRFWVRCTQLAQVCYLQFQSTRVSEAERGIPSSPESWDRLAALQELMTVAKREAAKLQPEPLSVRVA